MESNPSWFSSSFWIWNDSECGCDHDGFDLLHASLSQLVKGDGPERWFRFPEYLFAMDPILHALTLPSGGRGTAWQKRCYLSQVIRSPLSWACPCWSVQLENSVLWSDGLVWSTPGLKQPGSPSQCYHQSQGVMSSCVSSSEFLRSGQSQSPSCPSSYQPWSKDGTIRCGF